MVKKRGGRGFSGMMMPVSEEKVVRYKAYIEEGGCGLDGAEGRRELISFITEKDKARPGRPSETPSSPAGGHKRPRKMKTTDL
ncbi:hypothetical protein V6N12_054053 [Hibiscus sabdariffa]|uniref:Uncharacterized protein n=1 Tax=Hibiscus sabdariffa TaxID=183260 RepID=A0ABR2D9F4_9ROSI